jgi:hypothetical protein
MMNGNFQFIQCVVSRIVISAPLCGGKERFRGLGASMFPRLKIEEKLIPAHRRAFP